MKNTKYFLKFKVMSSDRYFVQLTVQVYFHKRQRKAANTVVVLTNLNMVLVTLVGICSFIQLFLIIDKFILLLCSSLVSGHSINLYVF